jgi:hypothetical protein
VGDPNLGERFTFHLVSESLVESDDLDTGVELDAADPAAGDLFLEPPYQTGPDSGTLDRRVDGHRSEASGRHVEEHAPDYGVSHREHVKSLLLACEADLVSTEPERRPKDTIPEIELGRVPRVRSRIDDDELHIGEREPTRVNEVAWDLR